MFPDAVVAFRSHVVEARGAFGLYQALAFAVLTDYDKAQFAVDHTLTVPVAAGGANFHLSRQNHLFHGGYKAEND